MQIYSYRTFALPTAGLCCLFLKPTEAQRDHWWCSVPFSSGDFVGGDIQPQNPNPLWRTMEQSTGVLFLMNSLVQALFFLSLL